MWKKKLQAAREAWEAAMSAANAKSLELEAKGEAVTAEDKVDLDDLITTAKYAKANFDMVAPMAEMEAQHTIDSQVTARRTFDNGAPAILPENSLGQSKALKVSNIWKATWAAGAGQNPQVARKFAGEEYDMSDRLKAAGYHAESMGGVLFPLGDEFLVEPMDSAGRKLSDFGDLRKEVRERLEIKSDPGQLAWMLKRFPEYAQAAYGLDRKDLALSDDTLGGFLVPTAQADRIIDLLRARSVVVRAGAQEVALPPNGDIAYPRLTSDPAFTYTDPDTTTDMATSNIGTGVVRLQAKSLRGAVTIPNDLIRYSSPSVEMVVRMALASKSALAEDNAFLENPGSSLAPKGVINYTTSTAETPTTGRVTLHIANTVGANGDTFDPEDVNKILALFYMANDPDPPTAWIMRPLLWAAINNRRADAVTAADKKGPFVFNLTRMTSDGPPTGIGGFPVYPTTQASANRTKGSSSVLVWTILANWRRAIIGRVGTIELAVSEHVKFLQDKTIIRAILRSDLGLEHEESFVFTDTLLEV